MTSTQRIDQRQGAANWHERLAATTGVYAAAAGFVTLVGWAASIPRLTDWKNDGISMFPNSAACALLSGLAVLLAGAPSSPRARTLLRAVAALVASVGGLTLVEHLTGVNLGIDTLLFNRPWGQVAATAPMRMGPPASLSFLATGTALLLLSFEGEARRGSAALGVGTLAVGLLSLTGHLYGASQMYMLPRLTGIAMQTATVVVALGLGLLARVPDYEPMRTLVEHSAAGILTRRAFPLVVGVGWSLGAVRLFLERQGLVDAAFGTALRTLVEIGLVAVLLWWVAGLVRSHERARRDSEADVRRQAGQLTAFLETAAIALHRVGPDGIILWANEAELETLGYRRDEYIGHHIAEFHVGAAGIADILQRLHRGERLYEYPAEMRCKDGSVKHVLIDSSVLWDEGRFVHTQCFTRDVTERKHAEATRAQLAAIVESSDDAMISKDLNGIIRTWNRGAERLFGYTSAEAVGKPVTMLIPPERDDEEPRILARIRRGEPVEHYETVRLRKDGTRVDISLSVSPVRDRDGSVIGASKVARDITQEKRGQEQREELLRVAERARQEAETANRAKDEFLAMLGHELRNPLSAVRSAVSAASLDEASRPRALEIARRQVDHLGRIVDDLLDVARITRGRVPLRKERVALSEVLQRAVEATRGLLDERGHALTLSLPEEAVYLQADPTRVQQAVVNILTNAAKYTDPGGTVSLEAERDDAGAAVVRVRDTGVGIAPEVLPRVFDLFTQGDRSLDRAQGGLGIGLTLVRRIVELHGGSVEAKSPGIGGGAEFVLRLPAEHPDMEEVVATSADSRPGDRQTPPARVLMVEDNPDAAESLVMILELLGHHVRVVHDGAAAVEAARANVPDIMLIDIGLPGMNGYQVAQAIRRDDALRHLVLVALTGYGRPEDKAQAMAAGFDYHLVKPVDLDALGDLVARLGAFPDDDVRRGPSTRH